MKPRLSVLSVWTVLLGVLAACAPSAVTPTPAALVASGLAQPKQLATVYISPTPNEAERQATRLASSPTPNLFPTPTLTPTATVYVGLFLGDSGINVPTIREIQEGAPPTITPRPSRCALTPDLETFGQGWQSNPIVVRGLGCPIEGTVPLSGSTQTFERGVMYGSSEGQLWAISTSPPARYWVLDTPPEVTLEEVNPPPGYFAPRLGFGAMWQGVDGLREALGFALFEEIRTALAYQRFEGGTLIYEGQSGQIFVLLVSGEAFGPYE